MKKILLSLFLLTAITSYSQFSLGLGSGVSSKQAMTFELHGKYDFKNQVFVRGGYITHISRMTEKGSIFNLRAGYNFRITDDWSFEPAGGIFYHLKSTDRKSINTSGLMVSTHFAKYLHEDSELYFGVNFVDRSVTAEAGIRYKF